MRLNISAKADGGVKAFGFATVVVSIISDLNVSDEGIGSILPVTFLRISALNCFLRI
jgi:hypothetical protein